MLDVTGTAPIADIELTVPPSPAPPSWPASRAPRERSPSIEAISVEEFFEDELRRRARRRHARRTGPHRHERPQAPALDPRRPAPRATTRRCAPTPRLARGGACGPGARRRRLPRGRGRSRRRRRLVDRPTRSTSTRASSRLLVVRRSAGRRLPLRPADRRRPRLACAGDHHHHGDAAADRAACQRRARRRRPTLAEPGSGPGGRGTHMTQANGFDPGGPRGPARRPGVQPGRPGGGGNHQPAVLVGGRGRHLLRRRHRVRPAGAGGRRELQLPGAAARPGDGHRSR